MKRVVKVRAEVARRPSERSAQVGTTNIPDEQRVASKDGVGFCPVFLQIEHQDRDGLDGVAGSFEDLEAQSRKVEHIAVLHCREGIFRLCAGTQMDGRAAAVAQLQMAGDEVGVEVGEKHVADMKAKLLGVAQVLLNVALRIDDDGSRTGLVSKQIRRMGEASQVVLFQNHVFSIGLPTENTLSKPVTSSRLSLSTYPHAPACCALSRMAASS